MSHERERLVAVAAVQAAARLCEQVRRELAAEALTKDDRSPVTVADYGSQAVVCRALAEAFPRDPIVAEEDASALRDPARRAFLEKVTGYVRGEVPGAEPAAVADWVDRGRGSVGARAWVLDPIDGTKGFLRGGQYAIALAFLEGGAVTLGALACPALPWEAGELERDSGGGGPPPSPSSAPGSRGVVFVAVRASGTWMHPLGSSTAPRRVQVAPPESTASLRLVESVESAHGDQEAQEAVARAAGMTAPALRMDSQAKYGVVARGEAALYLRLPSPRTPDYREKIWDHASGAILVEEAGGRVSDLHGRPLDFSLGRTLAANAGVVATNGALHERVLAALRSR